MLELAVWALPFMHIHIYVCVGVCMWVGNANTCRNRTALASRAAPLPESKKESGLAKMRVACVVALRARTATIPSDLR